MIFKNDIMKKKMIIIVMVISVVLLGLGLYFVIVDKPDKSTLSPPKTTRQSQSVSTLQPVSTATQNTQNYLEIEELGFKIPIDSAIFDDLTYKVMSKSTVRISTKTLNSMNKQCERDGVVAITKVAGTPGDDPLGYYNAKNIKDSKGIKQFNGFFLVINGPQYSCTEGKGYDLEKKLIHTIESGFQNISLIK